MKCKKRVIDIAMIVMLPVLMAYSLVGETLHEVAGVLMFTLFIVHHILNRAWYKSLPKGKYTARRVIRTVVNVMLIFVMIAQPVSGILMSKHLFIFIHLPGASATAREIHLCLAYWGFVLMSMHAGMHMGPVMNKFMNGSSKSVGKMINDIGSEEEKSVKNSSDGRRMAVSAVLVLISAYGVYAFIKRQLASYMFLRASFAFFDFSEPRIYFFMDYIAMVVLFALIGYVCVDPHAPFKHN